MLFVTFSSQPTMVRSTVFVVLTYGVLLRTVSAARCGQKPSVEISSRINFGSISLDGAWPWHGALFHEENDHSVSYVCGVSILSKRHVLAAAHCLVRENEYISDRRVIVQVGVTNLMEPGEYSQKHRVERIILHEFYNKFKHEDDISLLCLTTAITFNDHVQPICMWQGDNTLENVVGQIGYFVGWGRNENDELLKDLNEATAPIVSRRECLFSDPDHFWHVYYDKKTFCAGYRNKTTANRGDSGSGLYLQINNAWVLRGILSNIKYDADKTIIDSSSFMMFTDVSAYFDWIKMNVNNIEYNPEPVKPIRPVQPISHSTNLLGIPKCGIDPYPLSTAEESETSVSQYPWLAVIELQFFFIPFLFGIDFCHGIFIHPSFVLTTAICVKRVGKKARSVFSNVHHLGSIDKIFEDGENRVTDPSRHWIKTITVHPRFDDPKFANNIALLRLHVSSTVTPICLPPMGSVFPELVLLHVVGWNKTFSNDGPLVRKMVKRDDFRECRTRYSSNGIELDITGSQMCIDYDLGLGLGNCPHYYGSAPLQYMTTNNRRYFLVGLSNSTHQCEDGSWPDVFTNVEYYGDWIYNEVQQYQNP